MQPVRAGLIWKTPMGRRRRFRCRQMMRLLLWSLAPRSESPLGTPHHLQTRKDGSGGPTNLKQALEPYGAEQYKSNGVMVVARDRVQDAILERLAEDVDDIDDEEGTA